MTRCEKHADKPSLGNALAVGILGFLVGWALVSGVLMLLLGAAHAAVDERIPAVSYGGALVLSVLLQTIGICLGSRNTK